MSLTTAITLFYSNYFNFTGRTSRTGYWGAFLWQFVAWVAGAVITIMTPTLGSIVAPLIVLIHVIPAIAVLARRLHDISRSGWWILIGFIPLIGQIILIFWATRISTEGENQWGEPDA